MWHAPVLLAVLMVASCSSDGDVTGSNDNKCAAEVIPSYNPKSLEQCIAACRKCDENSTRASCSTACTFKGAR